MVDRERIEGEIRQALATATSAILLSNKLFAQDTGLFVLLGATEEERRAVAESPLFREAQQRLSALKKKEAAEFADTVRRHEESRA
jgi:hypothetical protein